MLNMVLPALAAFAVSLIAGPFLIRELQKLKFGQIIKPDGPQWHSTKTGTPTMGGILLLLALFVGSAVFIRHWDTNIIVGYCTILAYGLIGFLDDFISIRLKRNEGLSVKQKLLLQILLAAVVAVYAYVHIGSSIRLPFTNRMWDLGWFYIPAIMFVMVAVTNSANLTDGLDGLASGVGLVYFAAMAVAFTMFDKLGLDRNCVLLCSACAGACLGFLRFNSYPAKLFMGDTGSLALGAAVGWIAITARMPLWLPVMAAMYMISSVSVILQIASNKLTHKRMFKMAPIHHHFEKQGYPEMKVTAMYVIISAVLCLIGLAAIVV